MDKETLYIQNLALKKELNDLNEEIPALKTKINKLEEDLSQNPLNPQNCGTSGVNLKKKYLNLSLNLKELVQQANKSLKIKDNQLEKLKNSFKSTKIQENDRKKLRILKTLKT